jgi:hypothetical protein
LKGKGERYVPGRKPTRLEADDISVVNAQGAMLSLKIKMSLLVALSYGR